jgi:hypothetical protein
MDLKRNEGKVKSLLVFKDKNRIFERPIKI